MIKKFMKANPDKFQAICVGKIDAIKFFQLGDTMITCEDKVTLLGVRIDFQLNSNDCMAQTSKTKHINS